MRLDYKKNINELDFAKGILIILMVLFHIELIENIYPMLKTAVYAFHMAGFLVISGYLANTEKSTSVFLKDCMHILVPYIFFESIYIIFKYLLTGVLSISTYIEELTIKQLINYLLFAPEGPYWYLHTLIICLMIYYFVIRKIKLNINSSFIIIACIIYCLSLVISGFHWSNALYFITGAYLRSHNLKIEEIFPISGLTIIPLSFLYYTPGSYIEGSYSAFFITILVLSCFFWLYTHCLSWVRNFCIYLGKNTLSIVVFSPIFTITSKMFLKYFSFDSSGIIFAMITVAYVIIGSLISSKLCDITGISKLLFFKKKIYVNKSKIINKAI